MITVVCLVFSAVIHKAYLICSPNLKLLYMCLPFLVYSNMELSSDAGITAPLSSIHGMDTACVCITP